MEEVRIIGFVALSAVFVLAWYLGGIGTITRDQL